MNIFIHHWCFIHPWKCINPKIQLPYTGNQTFEESLSLSLFKVIRLKK